MAAEWRAGGTSVGQDATAALSSKGRLPVTSRERRAGPGWRARGRGSRCGHSSGRGLCPCSCSSHFPRAWGSFPICVRACVSSGESSVQACGPFLIVLFSLAHFSGIVFLSLCVFFRTSPQACLQTFSPPGARPSPLLSIRPSLRGVSAEQRLSDFSASRVSSLLFLRGSRCRRPGAAAKTHGSQGFLPRCFLQVLQLCVGC